MQARRDLVKSADGVNALDYAEVVDGADVPSEWRQRLVRVFFMKALDDVISAARFRIVGGDRIPEVPVKWALPWPMIEEFHVFVDPSALAGDDPSLVERWVEHLVETRVMGVDWQARLSGGAEAFKARWRELLADPIFRAMVARTGDQWSALRQMVGEDGADAQRLVVLRTASTGDYSTYDLRLETNPLGEGDEGLKGFDPVLTHLDLYFKVGCERDVDCAAAPIEGELPLPQPRLDYLARDFSSFRRLMFDRLAVTMPQWRDRSPADVGVALVEVMAYAADQLSYYQDAVATEAYLSTARQRISVRRHARLVDYQVHEGANARAFVHVRVGQGRGDARLGLSEPLRFLTRCEDVPTAVDPADVDLVVQQHRPQVFESLEPAYVSEHHNAIAIYDWGDHNYALPEGASAAALQVRPPGGDATQPVSLRVGDFLVFEQVGDPRMGAAGADPARRHVVRLTSVSAAATRAADGHRNAPSGYAADVANDGALYLEVGWSEQDALPFDLPVSQVVDGEHNDGLAVARGNMMLVDHGRRVHEEIRPEVQRRPYRPVLAQEPVTHAAPEPTAMAAAGAALRTDPRRASAQVVIHEGDSALLTWTVRPDLLDSEAQQRNFVVEVDQNGRATLRFGDGRNGRRPVRGSTLRASYRVGNGPEGNVAAEAIAHVVGAPIGVVQVRNPLAARGGTAPEALEQVRQLAPHAYRHQERAVTEDDYARMAERHPQVQRAVATRRWTGSWPTMFVSVDRVGGLPVDRAFEDELVAFLEQYRLAGDDLEIEPARQVPVEIRMTVCVEAGYYRSDVERALRRRFSTRVFADGSRGFFHPDNFTFGQPLYVSAVIAAAMEVEGVCWVDLDPRTSDRHNVFQARFGPRVEPFVHGKIAVGPQEVIRLDNDPNHRELGTIAFDFQGGR